MVGAMVKGCLNDECHGQDMQQGWEGQTLTGDSIGLGPAPCHPPSAQPTTEAGSVWH